ncbi:hypothetical protein GGI22_004458, partial [Coemansia erecta]
MSEKVVLSGDDTPVAAFAHSPDQYSSAEKLIEDAINTNGGAEEHSEGLDTHERLLERSPEENLAAESITPVPLLKLFRFATKTDCMGILAGTFFSCASGVIFPSMIIIFSNLMGVILTFKTLIGNGDINAANHYLDSKSRHYCMLFFVLGIVMWVVSFGVSACWAISAENQGLRIRKLYYKSIMRQDIGWFDTVKTGELTTRITNDVNMVQDGIGEKFGYVFINLVAFIASFIAAFIKGWKLTFICLTVVPLIAVAGAYMGITAATITTNAQDKTASSGAIADEVLSGIRTIMAFNGQAREVARYKKMVEEAYVFGRRIGFILGGSIGAIQSFIFVMYCVGFNFGSWRLRKGEYDPQQVLNIVLLLLIGGYMLSNVGPNASAITSAQGSAAKVFEIIDRVSPIDPLDTETGKKVEKINGDIVFRDIHFTYPSRPDVPILKGFNLEIRPGQKVAL